MAELKYSILAALLFLSFSCASQAPSNIELDNTIKGCFTLTKSQLEMKEELATLRLTITQPHSGTDCPCKSAIVNFRSYQNNNSGINYLLSGNFTTIGRDSVLLPVFVQDQLVFSDVPVKIVLSCTGN